MTNVATLQTIHYCSSEYEHSIAVVCGWALNLWPIFHIYHFVMNSINQDHFDTWYNLLREKYDILFMYAVKNTDRKRYIMLYLRLFRYDIENFFIQH